MDKRRLTTGLARYVFNPPARLLAGRRYWPFHALLETRGRRSGLRRRVPVGNGFDGDVLWIVTEHGPRAGYVRNLEADARVRVRVAGRWRDGTARVLRDDDPRERQRLIGRPFNGALVRAMGTDLLTVRIDLEPGSDRVTPDR
jgi:deazaflavin-dependent oxidoreductase (nitroreductase family)